MSFWDCLEYLATLHCIGVRCWPTQFCSKIFERPACRWAKHRRYPTSHSQVWSPSSNITQLLYIASKKVLHNLIRLLGVDLGYPRSKGDGKGHHSFKLNICFQRFVNCEYWLFELQSQMYSCIHKCTQVVFINTYSIHLIQIGQKTIQ